MQKIRLCTVCGERKPIEMFSSDRRTRDKISLRCRNCRFKKRLVLVEKKFEGVRICVICRSKLIDIHFGWRNKKRGYVSSTCKKCERERVKKYR